MKTLHVEINESPKKIKEAYLQISSYLTYKLSWPTKLEIEKCYVQSVYSLFRYTDYLINILEIFMEILEIREKHIISGIYLRNHPFLYC